MGKIDKWILWIGGIAIAIFFLIALSVRSNAPLSEEQATTTPPLEEDVEVDEEISGETEGTTVVFPPYIGDPIENIGNDSFIAQVPPASLLAYKTELAELKASLSKKPGNFDGWLRLGVIKKFFNNYTGARDAWEYANIIAPKNSSAYYNLGGLYGAYLKDFKKAEERYLTAIENDPKFSYLYVDFANFYWTFDISKKHLAKGVIEKGLVALPDDPSLLQALERY
jgi:tetratricopeptide (TPR) repeat protein